MSRFTFKTRSGAMRAAGLIGREVSAARLEGSERVRSVAPSRKAAARRAAWEQERAIVLPFIEQLRNMFVSRKGRGERA